MNRTPTSFLAASLRIFDLSVGQMLWSKRSIFLALLALGPVMIALILRLIASFGSSIFETGRGPAGVELFGFMFSGLHLRFIVPALGVFYGTSLISDEVDDKTITYLFTRPIPRGAVLIGKYLAYALCTILIILPSIMVVFALLIPIGQGSLTGNVPGLFIDLGLVALGLAAYGAVFAYIGAKLKRPLLFGLIFALAWEPAALLIPGYLRYLTVAYYLEGLVQHAKPTQGVASLIKAVLGETVSAPTAVATLVVMTLAFLLLATRTVGRREYVLEQ